MKMSDQEEREIRRYVESQTPHANEDHVTLVQKVGRRRVVGRTHELYDVRMAKGGRWWVITDMTNLYSQEDFNSIDEAFTYHLGYCLVLREQFKVEPDEEQAEYISRAWRRYAKAADAMSEAEEAEDFQAVGIRCREALLTLGREYVDAAWVRIPPERPKVADFKGWLAIYVDSLTAGKLNTYLRNLADKTWDLTVWLQHYTDATEWDAQLVLDATGHMLNTFTLAIVRYERGAMRHCPKCDSYRLTEDGDLEEQGGHFGFVSYDVCLACSWTSEPRFEQWSRERLQRLLDYANEDGRLER
jgi:hypothetical protein